MIAILTFVCVQLVIAVTVILVLKKLLDRELVDAALEKLESYKPADGIKQVSVRLAKANEMINHRLQSVCRKKFAQAQLQMEQDPAIKGGLIIELDGDVLDFSM